MPVPFEHWTELVSGYLWFYAGRTLAELPAGVELWLVWAWRRGKAAQDAADLLSEVRWPGKCVMSGTLRERMIA